MNSVRAMIMLQHLISFAFGTFLALFPVANPIGAVPIFYSLTLANTRPYRRRQARRIAINVVWFLALFLLAGSSILQFLGISLGVLRIAGGLLIAHTAWEMVTARQRLTDLERTEASDKEDISFTPMAVPLVSGPGAIGVVIGFSAKLNEWTDYLGGLLGIVMLGVLLYFCLRLGDSLIETFGKNEVGALNRILGFFILAIAVQFISEGTFALIKESAPGFLR
jgi:multiple antibiotic resistance protein